MHRAPMVLLSRRMLLLLPLLTALALQACGGVPGVAAPTAAPAPTNAPQPTAAPAPTAIPAPTAVPDSGITSLDDVTNAVLYIEVDGGIVPLGETNATSNAGSGSGFIIDPSGIAVTNNHVVTGASTIRVHVGGKKKDPTGQDARVLGISECSDLAVLQLLGSDKQYPYLKWYNGDIKNLLKVVAFGFPLDTPSIDTTPGSISQVDADGQSNWASLPSVLEHDARLNPGNSGGPLVAENGQVVGINYASNSKNRQYYAIGRDEALKMIDKLKQGKDDTSIGINGEAFAQDTDAGIWVRSVKPGSSASKAGLKPGDVITSMYNTPMAEDGTMAKYCQVLRSHPGEALNVSIVRASTSERLEGEINSDNAGLKVVASLQPTDAPVQEASYTNYKTITYKGGAISVDVPEEWSQTLTDGVWKLNDKEVGIEIGAVKSDQSFKDWTGPGVYILVSRTLAATTSPDQLLDKYKFTDTCTDGGRKDYSDNVYAGRYDYWKSCSGGTTELYVIAFQPEDKSFLGMLQIQVVGDADQEALKKILTSFQAKGDF